MKIMIANSKIKQKSKPILGVIRNLVLDFILYFVTVYTIWESTLYMQHEHRVKDQIYYASPEEVSKKKFMTNNLQQWLHTKMFNIIAMKNVHIMQIHTAICYVH